MSESGLRPPADLTARTSGLPGRVGIRVCPSLSEFVRVCPSLSESIRIYPNLSRTRGCPGADRDSPPTPPPPPAAAVTTRMGPQGLAGLMRVTAAGVVTGGAQGKYHFFSENSEIF